MKDKDYRQCVLQRGGMWQTAWIPARFAQLDKYLKIRGVNGWQVKNVGAAEKYSEVNMRSRDYLRTREASDI